MSTAATKAKLKDYNVIVTLCSQNEISTVKIWNLENGHVRHRIQADNRYVSVF